MTQTDKELAPIVAASAEGMVIECMHFSSSTWNIKEHVGWNPSAYTYRIIPPKPKMVKYYGYIDQNGFVRLLKPSQAVSSDYNSVAKIIRAPHLDCELPE
jgi:hypothetical protein